MPVEVATYVTDLVQSNPPTSDLETQGANHLQLIKTTLQNTFGTAAHRFVGLQTTVNFSASNNVLRTHGSNLLLINTGAGSVAMTLPTLAVGDAGWECSFMKTTFDINPLLIVPPSGTIQSGEYSGLGSCRRCIPGRRTRVIWTGSAFMAERVESRPVGTIFDWSFATLPVGYEWANGQTLSSSVFYPEYFSLNGGSGLTIDMRGRAAFGLDNVGGAGTAGRITVAGGNIDGTVIAGAGGAQNHTMTVGELASHSHANTLNESPHSHVETIANLGGGTLSIQSTGGSNNVAAGQSTQGATTGITITNANAGSGTPFTILPPAMILSKVLVVE